MKISPLAHIHPDAQLGENVQVDPFAVIHGDVVIGDHSVVGSHAVVADGARIGRNCKIFNGASVASIPQDLKFGNEATTLEIGDNTVIREFCTLNRGTKASGKTVIGSDCLLMAYVHVAHDCIIGDHCVIVNGVNLGGHVEIGQHVIVGGMTAVHQFVKIGSHAMVSGGSLVRKDVPPFVKAAREPLCYVGVNSIGLRRRGFSDREINQIQEIYRILFVRGYNTQDAIAKIEATVDASPHRARVLYFLSVADRGLMKGLASR